MGCFVVDEDILCSFGGQFVGIPQGAAVREIAVTSINEIMPLMHCFNLIAMDWFGGIFYFLTVLIENRVGTHKGCRDTASAPGVERPY